MPTFTAQDTNDFTALFLLKMNSCIAKALNELCSSSLIDSDQATLQAFLEDYFLMSLMKSRTPTHPVRLIIEFKYKNYE